MSLYVQALASEVSKGKIEPRPGDDHRLLQRAREYPNVNRNLLQQDFPKAEFRFFRKESVSGAAPELLELIASCDAVVGAVGD